MQRSDPRGSVVAYPDRHRQAWQLIWSPGDWGAPRHRLIAPLAACPETFGEAVHRRPEKVRTVGYPLARLVDGDGPRVLPALLLAASFSVAGDALLVDLATATPALNPDGLKVAARSSAALTQGALTDALLSHGADEDLATVASRLRTILAAQGGRALKPGDLLS